MPCQRQGYIPGCHFGQSRELPHGQPGCQPLIQTRPSMGDTSQEVPAMEDNSI